MPDKESSDASRLWSRVLLLVLSLLAVVIFMATPALITPYPVNTPWFESSALFPKLALLVMAVGGLTEIVVRRRSLATGDSEELDSSAANMRQAMGMLLLFALYALGVSWLGYLSSTLVFLLASSAWLGLGWRIGLGLGVSLSLGMWVIFVKVLKVYFGHSWLV